MTGNTKGFTLVEMMIVIIIIGILATIALPSYNQYVQGSALTDARTTLVGLAAALERHRAQNGTYTGSIDSPDGVREGPPKSNIYIDQSPENGTANFNLTILNTTVASYELRATAVRDTVVWDGDGNAPTMSLNALGIWNKCPEADKVTISDSTLCTFPAAK